MSNTFQRLIKEPAALKLLQEQISGLQSKGVEPSTPMVSLFVGLRGTPEELELPKRNFWCFPSWDHDQNCKVSRLSLSLPPPCLPSTNAKKDYEMGDVDSPPAFFVSFPAAKERTWVDRWGDKSVALVLAPAPYELFEKFEGGRVKHRGDEYLALKKRFENNLIAMLYTQLPQLKGKVAYVDVGSPLSNNYYLGTQRGEPYGLAATTERWADNGHWLRAQTPITGLYCCGADTLSPGVCGALTSGFFTAQAVCGLGFLVNHFELIA
jgi:all-trans-retinol 13,14-reductase